MYQLLRNRFPDSFRFGVADADLQVIGEQSTLDNEGSEPTMWTHFAQTSDVVFEKQTPLTGIDRFHRWNEDIDLMRTLGVRHYRTSVSMSRILKKDGTVNMKAIEWYRSYFQALRDSGIYVYVTLYHWELPLYLSEKGGWKNRSTADELVRHADAVYEHLNEYIQEYFILNEPFQSTFCSYHLCEHAPGERSLEGAFAAVHHHMLAQGMVLRSLKKKDPNLKIGTVYNPTVTYAASEKQEDVFAAQLAWEYQTGMFTEPLYRGEYPETIIQEYKQVMPVQPGDMEIIKVGDQLHAFGINFYRGKIIRSAPDVDVHFAEVRYPQGITNGLGWPVTLPPTYPEGFYDLMTELYHRYKSYGMKRMYITENGTCWDDQISKDGSVHDEFRIFYVREHLKQVLKAIHVGVPLESYFLWTLMDNYEWDLGYKPGSNFGIVHIDRKTLNRTPKDSFHWYSNVIQKKKLV